MHDQVGFVPGMPGGFNIQKSIHINLYCNSHVNSLKKQNHMIISTDAEQHLTRPKPHTYS